MKLELNRHSANILRMAEELKGEGDDSTEAEPESDT